MEKQRNSNFELLRIICIFGIVSMHTFGAFYDTATGINLAYGTLINSIFNMNVSIFMLMSGYFGIRFSMKKLVSLETTMVCYSVLGAVLSAVHSGVWSWSVMVKAFLPVSTRKFWYMSAYMILFVCSGYINKIPEKLDRKEFRKLILILLVFFSVMPTFLHSEIMRDNGKGLMNLFLIYLIGRYIRLYHDVKHKRSVLLAGWLAVAGITFLLNYTLAVLFGGVGLAAPFARDNSLTIIAGSVLAFLFFKDISFYSRIVNKIGGCMFAIYLFDAGIRSMLNHFITWEDYASAWYLFALIAGYAVVVMIIGVVIESVRRVTLARCDGALCRIVTKVWGYMDGWINRYFTI